MTPSFRLHPVSQNRPSTPIPPSSPNAFHASNRVTVGHCDRRRSCSPPSTTSSFHVDVVVEVDRSGARPPVVARQVGPRPTGATGILCSRMCGSSVIDSSSSSVLVSGTSNTPVITNVDSPVTERSPAAWLVFFSVHFVFFFFIISAPPWRWCREIGGAQRSCVSNRRARSSMMSSTSPKRRGPRMFSLN